MLHLLLLLFRNEVFRAYLLFFFLSHSRVYPISAGG
jgi:hypothetical protein